MATSWTDLSWGHVLEWRWTALHSVLSMWWELQCLQEWKQRCVFGLLWHMFTCYRDPAMIVSMKHSECYKLFKRLDKQVTASAKEMYIKEKGSPARIQALKWQVPFCSLSSVEWGLDFPSAAEELIIKHLQARTWGLCSWNVSPDLFVSFHQTPEWLLPMSVWSSSTLGPFS